MRMGSDSVCTTDNVVLPPSDFTIRLTLGMPAACGMIGPQRRGPSCVHASVGGVYLDEMPKGSSADATLEEGCGNPPGPPGS
jgi:hypothetical protein